MKDVPLIKLYGSKNCHKTQYYKSLFNDLNLNFQFLDVIDNEDHAVELRGLYQNGKLNFPTITIDKKKLRNPRRDELIKWINKLSSET